MSSLPRVIGITGKMRSGKDTTSEWLVNQYGYVHLSFAAPLKRVCGTLFNFDHDQLYGNKKNVKDDRWYGITPREVLQFVGTELFRNNMGRLLPEIKNNFWAECLKREVIVKLKEGKSVVVSDVRFPNEAEVLRQIHKSTKIYRVNRENRGVDGAVAAQLHSSETEMNGIVCDHEIENNGTLRELYGKVDDCLFTADLKGEITTVIL